jgi:hypothetical protein
MRAITRTVGATIKEGHFFTYRDTVPASYPPT